MKNIIFIGGIHGVGKGTICTKIAEKFNLIHISASEVLKWEEISALDNKVVQDFEFTQNRLLSNLKKTTSKDKNYLLDGHYCLLNSNNSPERIDKQTFASINPKAFIVVVDDVHQIKSRLETRDQKEYDINVLDNFQKMELDYSKSLSLELSIPLVIVENGNIDNLLNFLNDESIA